MTQKSIHDAVAATLRKMGFRVAPMWTILIKKGYLVGHKYRFHDGGYAIWLASKNVIEVYDRKEKLVKMVSMETLEQKKAA